MYLHKMYNEHLVFYISNQIGTDNIAYCIGDAPSLNEHLYLKIKATLMKRLKLNRTIKSILFSF